MTCEVCTLHSSGREGEAARIEAIRHRRLLLAALTESSDAATELRAEINDCVDCLLRIAAAFVSINAGFTIAACGDVQEAITEVQRSLLTYIDMQPHGRDQGR